MFFFAFKIQSGKDPEVSVQDFGIGIAKEHHQHIFECFYQVTDPDGQTYPGLGIGLYIASEIIWRHGGRIWVKSTKGEGSTFALSLPLTQETKETSSSDK
jgi:signal transduction histidine kinase